MKYLYCVAIGLTFSYEKELNFEELDNILKKLNVDESVGLEIIVGNEYENLYKIIRYPTTSCNYGNYIKVEIK
jgi:hypothetical protein